jgi:DNA-binding SARP family transcriptional activator
MQAKQVPSAYRLKLDLLGGFSATYSDDRDVAISTKKGRALIAITALSPAGGCSRDRLASLLWSDRGDDQARSSLRQTLAILR